MKLFLLIFSVIAVIGLSACGSDSNYRKKVNADPKPVDFTSYSRTAFSQNQNQEPLLLDAQNITQDVVNENAYDDLLM